MSCKGWCAKDVVLATQLRSAGGGVQVCRAKDGVQRMSCLLLNSVVLGVVCRCVCVYVCVCEG